jgi:hypothetical protein
MDNGGRNIHEFDLTPATSGLGDPIKAEVHAVNEWSARATILSFLDRYEKHEVALADAPK